MGGTVEEKQLFEAIAGLLAIREERILEGKKLVAAEGRNYHIRGNRFGFKVVETDLFPTEVDLRHFCVAACSGREEQLRQLRTLDGYAALLAKDSIPLAYITTIKTIFEQGITLGQKARTALECMEILLSELIKLQGDTRTSRVPSR